jgi:hypothetical protein
MAPKTVSAAQYAKMTQPERYAYISQGGLHPDMAAQLTAQGLDQTRPGANRQAPTQAPPAERLDTKDPAMFRRMLDRAGIGPADAVAAMVENPAIWNDARSTGDVFKALTGGMSVAEFVSTRDQLASVQYGAREAEADGLLQAAFDYRVDAADALSQMVNGLDLNQNDPRVIALLDFFEDDEERAFALEQVRDDGYAKLAAEQSEREAERAILDHKREQSERAQLTQMLQESTAYLDSLEAPSEHVTATVRIVLDQATAEGTIPTKAQLEEAVKVGQAFDAEEARASAKRALNDQIDAALEGVQPKDPYDRGVDFVPPTIIEPDYAGALAKAFGAKPPSVAEQFDAAIKPDVEKREAAHEIQVTAAQTIAAAEEGPSGKSAPALEWEARQADRSASDVRDV